MRKAFLLVAFVISSCGSRTGLADEDSVAPVMPVAPPPRGPCARAATPDFNGDGVGDLAVATGAGVIPYYGTRGRLAPTPGARIPYPPDITADTANLACLGDLDGDGTSELALYRRSAQASPDLPGSPFRSGGLYVISGSRDGLSVLALRGVLAPAGMGDNFPASVFYGGRLLGGDRGAFVVSLTAGRGVFVYRRAPDGAYEAQSAQPLEATPGGAYASVFARGAGDVDGDGLDDLAIATDDVAAFYAGSAAGPASLVRRVLFTDVDNRVGPYLDGVGDVTGDRCADLLMLEFNAGGTLSVFAGSRGFGASTPWAPLTPEGRAVSINGSTDFVPTGDVDGDGADDVLLYGSCLSGSPCPSEMTQRFLYRGGPSGLSVTPLAMPPAASRGTQLRAVGDVDGDGRAELGEYTRASSQITLWRGTPSGYTTSAQGTISRGGTAGTALTGSVP